MASGSVLSVNKEINSGFIKVYEVKNERIYINNFNYLNGLFNRM